jgi:hypothetical protein
MSFEPLIRFRPVELTDGLGVIAFDTAGDGVVLELAGDEPDNLGSIGWLARRIVPQPDSDPLHRPQAWVAPDEWAALRDRLRHIEAGDDLVALLRPLLGLFAPGQYAIGAQAVRYPHIRATDPAKVDGWYADEDIPQFGTTFIPTHHWPPPDWEAVADHRRRIKAGDRPAVVTVTHPDSAALYVIDGHHKLTAYLQLERDPVCVVIVADPAAVRGSLAYLDFPSLEYRMEENESGSGVLDVVGRDGASALCIGGRALLVEGRGGVDRLAVRTGDARLRRQARRLRESLREADPYSAAEMTRAVWPLLPPGRYGLRRWVPETHAVEASGSERLAEWNIGAGPVLLPTDRWPPPDADAAAEFARVIGRGERPLVMTLRASPPGDEADAVAFVVDGHHRLAAYQRAGVPPHCLDIAGISDDRACAPGDLESVVGDDGALRERTAVLLDVLRTGGPPPSITRSP